MGIEAIGGGLLSLVGTAMTNESNRAIADQANNFSAAQYASRYQTTVKDMQAAGLSPMLAYSQGAGSSPSGQVGHPQQNTLGSAVEGYNKGLNAEIMRQQLSNLEKQGLLTDMQTIETDLRGRKLQSETTGQDLNNILTQMFGTDIKRQELYNLGTAQDLQISQTAVNNQQAKNLVAGIDQIIQNIETGKASAAQHYAMIDQLKAATANLKLDASEKIAMAKMWDSLGSGGAAAKTFVPFLQLLKSLLGK